MRIGQKRNPPMKAPIIATMMAKAGKASAAHTDDSHHGTPTNRKLAGASPTLAARPRGPYDQHEGRVISEGHCDGDAHGAVDQQTHDCDRSGTGGERGRRATMSNPRTPLRRPRLDAAMRARSRGRTKDRARRGRTELDAQDSHLGRQSATPAPAAPNEPSNSRLSTTLTGAAAMLDMAICPSRPGGDRMHIATK